MVSMDIHKSRINLQNVLLKSFVLSLMYGFTLTNKAYAFDWSIRPSLSMTEMFSDNLTLSDTAKRSGFVTEVAPGLSMYGISPWSNFNLNYRLQGLYNAGGNDAVDINHQLQMNSLYQVVRNRLFIESNSSISQINTNNSFIATDNLSGNNNRTDAKNFSISPYWTPKFGQYASGLVKVGYQKSTFDNLGNSKAPTLNQISNSDVFSRQASLSSGSKFNHFRWNLNYSAQDQNRDSGDDVKFENYKGDTRYYFSRKYNVFADFGYENNDYQTIHNDINNGFFYTFGGQWNPSQFYSLEAGYGNNSRVTVRLNPSANLTSHITYENRSVGLNTGSVWNGSLNYRVKQAVVNFNYSQDTTTVQQLLSQQQVFNLADPFGNTVIDPVTQQPQQFIINSPNLVNDVIINKTANLSLTYQSGKSNYNASVYNTRRTYEQSTEEDNVYGASAGWRWQFQPRLNFYLQPLWQTTDISGSNGSSNNRYDVALGLSRSIPINLGRPLSMNTNLEFRHIEQKSNISINDYTENRATANFAVRF